MTITVPETKPGETGTEDELIHVVCCDPDVAMCGMDVSGYRWVPHDEPATCELCAIAYEEDLPCPKCHDYE